MDPNGTSYAKLYVGEESLDMAFLLLTTTAELGIQFRS